MSDVYPDPPLPSPATSGLLPGGSARVVMTSETAPATVTPGPAYEAFAARHEPLTVKPSDDVPRELAAALAETRTIRDGYQELCEEFGPSPQSGWSARISLTVLNRHQLRAGLPELPRTRRDDAEDITMRYRRERDEAREQLAVQHEAMTQLRADHSEALAAITGERDRYRRLAQKVGDVLSGNGTHAAKVRAIWALLEARDG